MTARKRIGPAVAMMLLSLLPSCGGDDPKPCEPTACYSGAWIHIPLTLTASALTQTTATICRNDACYDWVLPGVSSDGVPQAVPAAPNVVGTIWLTAQQSITLDIEWRVEDASLLQNGDHYVVKLTTGNGSPTVAVDASATYTAAVSGSSGCDPVCTVAQITP
jgi:hypothetical protein